MSPNETLETPRRSAAASSNWIGILTSGAAVIGGLPFLQSIFDNSLKLEPNTLERTLIMVGLITGVCYLSGRISYLATWRDIELWKAYYAANAPIEQPPTPEVPAPEV